MPHARIHTHADMHQARSFRRLGTALALAFAYMLSDAAASPPASEQPPLK